MNRFLALITIAGCAGEPPERLGRSVPAAHTDRSLEQAEMTLRKHVEAYLGVELELELPPTYSATDAGCEPLATFAAHNVDGDIICRYGYTIVTEKPSNPNRCRELYVFAYPTISTGALIRCQHAYHPASGVPLELGI